MIRRAALLALLAWGEAARAQTSGPPVSVRDPGEGPGPQILQAVLAQPHRTIPPSDSAFVVRRGATERGPLLVLGRDVVVDGTIDGDVIVVDGSVYTHPGARITGGAITFGGGVYESALATIAGGATTFRDFTYDIAPVAGGYTLRYRQLEVSSRSVFERTGPVGIAIPTYDRSNGLSLPIAAELSPPRTALDIEPRLTYRSQLGRLDPSLALSAEPNRHTTVRLAGGRITYSNDAWIRPDLANSVDALLLGDDMRNYYRATRGDAAVSYRMPFSTTTLEPYVGARWERASSVRPDSFAVGGPWSLFGRHSTNDMLRPNPRIDDADIASLVAGSTLDWVDQGVIARARVDVELGQTSRVQVDSGVGSFAQVTFDGSLRFRTFRSQVLRVDAHAVLTSPGTTPRQRWAYIGGPGTILTLDPLQLGGDELVFFDAQYAIPIERVKLPFVGSPVVTLRDALGSAGVRSLPALEQAVGARLSLGFVYGELSIDPVSRHTIGGFGIALAR